MRGIRDIIRGAGYHSKVLLIIGVIIAFPASVIIFYPGEARYMSSFLVPGGFIVAFGLALALVTQRETVREGHVFQSPIRKGSLSVLFAWCCAILAGSVPFVFGGQLDFVHALFESVSGWTTTGLTVSDIPNMPHIFLFHRAFIQYCGGLGFIVVIAVVLHGKQLTSMYAAEGHPDGIMPSIRRTAIVIISIYMSCLVVGTILYSVFGMRVFESICHTMSALSTAGFSTRAESILEYGSLPIEIVTIFLMLIGCSNFAVLTLVLRGKIKRVLKISEVRFMLWVIALFVLLMMIPMILNADMGFFKSLRESAFCVVTMFTTTGYSISDYAVWPPFAMMLIMLLMALGGGTGSTAGGIKMLRAYIVVRVTKENIRRRMSPNHNVRVMHYMRPNGEAPIDNNLIRDTFEFVTVYFGILVVGTLLITLFEGCSLSAAAYEFTSAFGTVGVSNGLTARASTPTLFVEMAGMLMGRLEIFILFIGLHTLFLKAKDFFAGQVD